MRSKLWPVPVLRLALLTVAAVLIHGYHLGSDDAGIYLPTVKKIMNPALYPFGAEFFLDHAKLSKFSAVVGESARLIHLSGDTTIFLWYVGTVFAFLLASWLLASTLFSSEIARWSSTLLMTGLLTLPAAGTSLVLMDPYLTGRSASTPLTMFAVAAFLARRRELALLCLLLAVLVHPLMAVYAIGIVAVLALPARWTNPFAVPVAAPSDIRSSLIATGLLPAGFNLTPATPAYRKALEMRTFLFLSRWQWFEWIGLAAPLVILAWAGGAQLRGTTPALNRIARACLILGVFAIVVAAVFSSSSIFDNYARLQPLRVFQLVYIVFFVLLGGLLGEYLLKRHRWRWIVCFGVLWAGMFLVQRATYSSSRHVETPWSQPINPWVKGFYWVRENTPIDAVFALDPTYIGIAGEDVHVFRAIAERSALTDLNKDSGVVSLFPQLAPEWWRQQQAQQGWKTFQLADFQRLSNEYPVSWVIIQGQPAAGLDCKYRNEVISVCHIPGAAGLKPAVASSR